ncbi:hypothetical protein N8371_09675, partial [Vicingaceae bacterium]|nr:hypothetical protein [Vicingaceae bacterium]
VIGAYQNDGGGSNSGHTRVYEIIAGSWYQTSQDLNGEAANDHSGWSVAINGAGDRVSSGAIYNDGGGRNAGHVRVYEGSDLCSQPFSISISPSTTASIDYQSVSYCRTETDPTPVITGSAGGVFSSSSGLSINSTTGEVDLSSSSLGVYYISYNLNANSCGPASVTKDTIEISQSSSSIQTITSCDSYTWIDNKTYTASNITATYTLTNKGGCDSLITLDLTINNSPTIGDTITTCNSYTWVNGLQYSSTGTYYDTIPSLSGCDTLRVLELNIDNIDVQNLSVSNRNICAGSSTIITTSSSEIGVSYTLKNLTSGIIISGPVAGTGSGLTFNTGVISTSTNFYVYAEKNSPTGSGICFANTNSIAVNVQSAQFKLSKDTLISCGIDSVQLDALVGYTSYLWSNNDNSQKTYVSSSGMYYITVTSSNGCFAQDSIYVSLINAKINQSDTAVCSGTAINIGVINSSAGSNLQTLQYKWTSGATTSSINVSPAQTTTYYVTVTDGVGSCVDSVSINVLEGSIVKTNVSCNGGNDGSATASGTRGTTPYSYLWSNAATTASITGLTAGTYTVTVTDGNACTITSFATITEPTALTASTVNTNVSCNGGSDGSATASGTGGTTPYSYLWSNASATASITGVVAGTYTVTISDANNCTTTSSVTIAEPTALVASSVVNTAVSCNGGSDGSATASAMGGTIPYSYLWSNSATTASITGLTAGTYTVTVTDGNACTITSIATITEPTALVASSIVNTNASCNGGNGGS